MVERPFGIDWRAGSSRQIATSGGASFCRIMLGECAIDSDQIAEVP